MKKYTVGLDFGSLSVRAVLADTENGRELASAVYEYPHAVITDRLPSGKEIPLGWALQPPGDYLEGLSETVGEAVRLSGVSAEDIVGIGIDFTANTYLPVNDRYEPLCLESRWENEPHAWVKMWKHNSTQKYAEAMEQKARERQEPFLKYYSDTVSSAWMLPRLYETLEEAPALYEAAYRFMEAGDWIVTKLTGMEKRSASFASIKAFYVEGLGYPPDSFFASLDPRFEHVIDEKLARSVYPQGTCAGGLNRNGAALTGLPEGIPVAVANIDATAGVPCSGVTGPGILHMTLGTSSVYNILHTEFHEVQGTGGITKGGVIPGLYGYESGQNCVGDCLNWFVENCVPPSYYEAAKQQDKNIHQYLTELAERLEPGESGLLALDWWNGNRAVLCDYDLTGLLLGLTLRTKPEEIYRALIEALAFGTRKIVETLAAAGVPAGSAVACGGITRKNPLYMQIHADVLNMEIKIARSDQTSALGSAIFGAVAAGSKKGGYDTISEAVLAMGGAGDLVYRPIREHTEIYNGLYTEFCTLHDYFGRGENTVMKKLRSIR